MSEIAEVVKKYADTLMAIPGVVGVAEGKGGDSACVIVFVARKTPSLLRQIPPVLDSYPVCVEASGDFHAT